MPSNTLFDGKAAPKAPVAEPASYLEVLVGDGKKFKDQESLARGKYESDQFIETLQTELAEAREEANKRKTVEEMVEKIMTRSESDSRPNASNQDIKPVENAEGDKLSIQDVEKLFNKKLQEATSVSRKQSNVDKVQRELQNLWGDNYKTMLTQKTHEFGVPQEFLASMAEDHPDAFLKLVGDWGPKKESAPSALPRSVFNTTALSNNSNSNNNVKNNKYFEKMRKETPANYWKPETQMAIHAAAFEMGDAFYN